MGGIVRRLTIALAIAVAAVAAPVAGAQAKVDPQRACSYAVKPSSCFLTPAQARARSVTAATALGAIRISLGATLRPD